MAGGSGAVSSALRGLPDGEAVRAGGCGNSGGTLTDGEGATAQEASHALASSVLAIIVILRTKFGLCVMTLLLLEALGALLLLVFIVWWTMFSGRKNGELPGADDKPDATTLDRDGK